MKLGRQLQERNPKGRQKSKKKKAKGYNFVSLLVRELFMSIRRFSKSTDSFLSQPICPESDSFLSQSDSCIS